MDPVSLFAVALIAGMSWNIDQNEKMNEALMDHVIYLEQEIIDLEIKQQSDMETLSAQHEKDFLTMAAETSAIAAAQAVVNQKQADKDANMSDRIGNLDQKFNYLDKKIMVLHP